MTSEDKVGAFCNIGENLIESSRNPSHFFGRPISIEIISLGKWRKKRWEGFIVVYRLNHWNKGEHAELLM
jgi:hypothetical protein